MNEGLFTEVLASLDICLFERVGPGSFISLGKLPSWFLTLCPCTAENELVELGETFPFLEAFFDDAEAQWSKSESGRLKSGPWIETGPDGRQTYLEATALCADERKLLIVEHPKIPYHEHVAMVQVGRETALERDRMARDSERKEILLHCIVHDLKGPLSGIAGSISLLTSNETLPGQKEMLDVALRQSSRLDLLIQGILHAFSAEVESLQQFVFDIEQAPDALACASEAAMAMAPAFKVAKVQLDLDAPQATDDDWAVVGEKVRLERVLQNLLGNALRYSPKRSTVSVRVGRSDDSTTFAVEDEGPGVPLDVRDRLFKRFSQGGAKAGSAGLGLYFCRITVERWGGSIGYEPRPEGGSRFWFTLKRASRSTPVAEDRTA